MEFHDVTLTKVIRRLDILEIENANLVQENKALQRRLHNVEDDMTLLRQKSEDTRRKLDVLREAKSHPAVYRVCRTLELLEMILVQVPSKQLFRLQQVSKTFQEAIEGLPSLRTKMFRNAGDRLLLGSQFASRKQLNPPLQLNPFLPGSWKSSSAGHSGINLRLFPSKWLNAWYQVSSDLSANFSFNMGSLQETRAGIERQSTSRAKTYMTLPALPTSIRVNFVDALKMRNRQEYERACNSSSICLPNVTAIVEATATTLLDMLRIAETVERYYRQGEKDWLYDQCSGSWRPKSATEDEKSLLSAVKGKPTYSGYSTEGPYRP